MERLAVKHLLFLVTSGILLAGCQAITQIAQGIADSAPPAKPPEILRSYRLYQSSGDTNFFSTGAAFKIDVRHGLFNELTVLKDDAPVSKYNPPADSNDGTQTVHTMGSGLDDMTMQTSEIGVTIVPPTGGFTVGSVIKFSLVERSINPKYRGTPQERALKDFTVTVGNSILPGATELVYPDTLEVFAKRCDRAIGVTVPDFNSDDIFATEVPTTHVVRTLFGTFCDRPNVLKSECDPGSRFRVLVNDANAYVVAHSRKQGNPAGQYGDIAVIQHNKINGATCFYQGALNLSRSGDVKAPSKGVGNPPFWMTPSAIANSSFSCVRCHDNGPIIRSPYLTQITGANKLPGAGDDAFNRDQPYSFVGPDFASWKAYKVEVSGNLCNTCHRLGVNSVSNTGTARVLGITATDASQLSKNHPHSADSPMWMLRGQTKFSQENADAALAIKQCADQFNEGSPLPDADTCRITRFTSSHQ